LEQALGPRLKEQLILTLEGAREYDVVLSEDKRTNEGLGGFERLAGILEKRSTVAAAHTEKQVTFKSTDNFLFVPTAAEGRKRPCAVC
jgi:hypothetical protein